MKVKVKAIHFDAAEKLMNFINKKAEKLGKHYEDITEVEVALKVIKPETSMNKEAGVKLISPEHEDLFASKVADTFEEAIDLSIEALEKQLEKKKAKK
ncbi:MAG: HPF/RaiA family ribosome-associated protein [Muribaculaceae bacterium]|nr:HPF/RaiA family ribosome-associated protein [Muribaculaceae bacterium]